MLSELLRYFPLSEEQLASLEAHRVLLERWNQKLNLTRVLGEEAILRHYGEALFLATHLPTGIATVADVGSGPGFPGVPLSVLRPDLSVTLIESHARKAVFLRESCRLPVLNQRAELIQQKFDCLVSRAVSPLEVAALVPRLAPQAWMLMARSDADGSTWNIVAELPWDRTSVVAFHVKQSW